MVWLKCLAFRALELFQHFICLFFPGEAAEFHNQCRVKLLLSLYNGTRCAAGVFTGSFHFSATAIGAALFSVLALLEHMIHFCLMLAAARKPHAYCSLPRLEKYISNCMRTSHRGYLLIPWKLCPVVLSRLGKKWISCTDMLCLHCRQQFCTVWRIELMIMLRSWNLS